MLLEQAMCVLEDLRAGSTSPNEESVSDTISTIQEFRKRIRPKIVAGWGLIHTYPPSFWMDGCFLVNPAALQFVSILDDQGRIHKEARQAQSDHEWIDLCLDANRNDLQAGRGRSLHDAKENESIQGNQRRLRIGSLHKYLKVWLVCETSFWNSPRP